MAPLDRRGFLQSSAAVTAASLAVQPAQARAAQGDLEFALVGAGNQGRHIAGQLLKVSGARLAAVCEINPLNAAEAKKLAPQARVYEDWSDLLAKERNLAAVIVALPEHTHADASIAALKAGKHVFCEKPMAYAIDEARAMIAARDVANRVLQIGQQRRSNPLYYLAERLVQKEGVLGEILRIDAFWDRETDWKRPLPKLDKDFSKWGFPTLDHLVNWRLYRKYGHGLMTENGTHQMDASGWLLGGKRPRYVCGMGTSRYRDGRETHDICSAEYMYEGDYIVRFTQDFHQGFNYGWSYGELLLGADGAMRITAEQEIWLYDKQRKPTRISIERLGAIELGGVGSTVEELKAAEGDRTGGGLRTYSYANEMRIFAHAVREGTKPTCTGEIGLNSIAVTITGTDAQFANEYRKFDAKMFA
ncbi:MAG: Gfo/Idh/MocA family oxidoreductase [Pirellulales bacterium]